MSQLFKQISLTKLTSIDFLSFLTSVIYESKTQRDNGVALNKFINIVKKVTKHYKMDVNLVNKELLYSSSNVEDTVTILTPNHDHPLLDIAVFGNYYPGKIDIFIAGNVFIPKFLRSTFDKHPQILYVGSKTQGPVDKLIKRMKENKTRFVFIQPEGNVSAGPSETKPIRRNFSATFVKRLIDEGLNIKILPITYTKNGSFITRDILNLDDLHRKLEVVFDEPLSTRELKSYYTLFDKNFLELLIRAHWVTNQQTNLTYLAGQYKIESFYDFLKNYHGENFSSFLKFNHCQQKLIKKL